MWMSKRCHCMSFEIVHMSAYLAYCRQVPTRILNCLKCLPVLAIQSGCGFSRTNLATPPHIVVQLLYTLSPIVVRSRVFSPSQNNRQVLTTTLRQCTGFLWVLYYLGRYNCTNIATYIVPDCTYPYMIEQLVQTRTNVVQKSHTTWPNNL